MKPCKFCQEKEQLLKALQVKPDGNYPWTFSLFGKLESDMDEDEIKAAALWLAYELKKLQHPFLVR